MKKVFKIISLSNIFCIILATGCSKSNWIKSSNLDLQKNSTSNISILTSKSNTNKSYKYFLSPEKIVVYNHDNEKVITKGNELYDEIMDLTDKRFNNKSAIVSFSIKKDELNQIKKNELVVEFTYYALQQTKYGGLYATINKRYKGLILPLTGKYANYMFFDAGNKESVGPIVTTSSPDDLIRILE